MASPIEPGVTLSGRLISQEIGRGGFSRVFRAEPVGGGAAVAVKVAVRSELVAALRTEGNVLRRLRSPHFVEILEEHLEEDPPYFVLELCEGGDLRKRLDAAPGRRVGFELAERWILGVLEGMAFAHDEGFVHGDLKPENVLLGSSRAGAGASETVKIADLGLSRAHRKQLVLGAAAVAGSLDTRDDGRIRGTFDYLAPEVRAGHDLSPASDVYALGVFLYEMLVGMRPLGAFQLPRAVLARDGVTVPEYLDRVCARALAHDVHERYPDASIMLADLRAKEQGIALELPTEARSGPRAALVRPVPDAVFVTQIYLPLVVPLVLLVGSVLLARAAQPASPQTDAVLRWALVGLPLAATGLVTWLLGRRLGREEGAA